MLETLCRCILNILIHEVDTFNKSIWNLLPGMLKLIYINIVIKGELTHNFYASASVAFLAYFCTAIQKEVPILILNYV